VTDLPDIDRDDAEWREAARAHLLQADAALAARFDAGEAVARLLDARARAVDAVVRSAWARSVPTDAALSLLATGGYGRGELFPQSDIDLLVLAEPEAQAAYEAALSRFFMLLWDAGLSAGHAVRSAAQCAEAAVADITVVTAMIEVRLLAGDADALQTVERAIAPDRVWPPDRYFAAKRREQSERHARFNDTAYNLEPNLKEGPGGLRDLHTLAWMARRIHGVPSLGALVPLGQLGEDEFATLERERHALSRLRFGLHLVAGRREERLLFDHQKPLAARLGLRDERSDNLAVEQMMQGFFRSAATVLRINDRLLQRFEEQLEGEAGPVPIDADFVARRGYLALREPARIAGDPALAMRLFAVWAAHPQLRGLHSESARALAESLASFPAYTDADPALRAQFVELLRGPQAVTTLARMAQLGVLARYLPAFGRVSGRMQYDLFHVYTVDQHTLAVLRNIESFARPESAQRFALGHELWPRLRKPELLLLAGLFHDIAKGRGGDHSELGAEDALAFGEAHALPAADTQLVAWLVRHHLLMSVTAQRQDISDPEVVNRFATRVGDREHLDYLYLLTVADIAGTSPKLWNAWKDRLIADLYAATRFVLRRGLEHPVYGAERIAETRSAARALLLSSGMDADRIDALWREFPDESFLRYRPEQIAWQTEGIASRRNAREPLVRVRPLAGGSKPGARALEVFVYSPDRDGLFAAVTASLDRLGLNVLAARVVTSTAGMSLDTFQVLAADNNQLEPETLAGNVERRLFEVLSRSLDQVRPSRRALPRHFRHFRVPVQVDFADAGRDRTQLTLVCTDRPGLLADVAQVLRKHRLRVHDARIATFGERVEDFFLITDEHDRALVDPERLQAVRDALAACVDGGQHGKTTQAAGRG
jgi:[protein-PII] uridylyltransferase